MGGAIGGHFFDNDANPGGDSHLRRDLLCALPQRRAAY